MLSWIASDFFADSSTLIFPLIGLGLFMTIFVLMCARVLLTRKDDLERMARMPLEADDG